jgi:cystathionine gamma-synthase
LRLSVGIESPEDLVADLQGGLERAQVVIDQHRDVQRRKQVDA